MEELVRLSAGYVAVSIELLGIVIIAIGTLEAAVAVGRVLLKRTPQAERRQAWLRYMHWLAAGLTFQLAGDIVHSAVAPTWDDIGKLAAIAAVRTFLNYFLERDFREAGGG
jgi:uncharacterized membrane protein